MQNHHRNYDVLKIACATVGCLVAALGVPAQSVPPLINYQGRLTDATGAPLPAGLYAIQFRIWDSPTGSGPNDLIWGQQQNLTVQSNGLFNVILGSPGGTPIPNATPAVNNLAYAFTGSNCFLGVTVAVSNGVAIASISEITPRQQLLSVPYSLVAGSVVPGAIGSQQIAVGAIGSQQIAVGAIGSQQIAVGGIENSNLAVGIISPTNVIPRQTGTNVGVGGLAISLLSDGSHISSHNFVNVPNLSVTITTTGRPVFVGLVGGFGSNGSVQETSSYGDASLNVAFFRGSTLMQVLTGFGSPFNGPGTMALPPSSFWTVDFAPPGTSTYTVQAFTANNDNGYIQFLGVQLVAYEL